MKPPPDTVWHLDLGSGMVVTSDCQACNTTTKTLCGSCFQFIWNWEMDSHTNFNWTTVDQRERTRNDNR